MTVKKIKPVLQVDEIESRVRFWTERVAIEVPEGNVRRDSPGPERDGPKLMQRLVAQRKARSDS
jgi:hypothetical protein